MSTVALVMAQINTHVGDIPGNCQRIIDSVRQAEQNFGADIVLFPELTLCGYPPEDLLLRPSLQLRVEEALQAIQLAGLQAAVIIGYPKSVAGRLYNMAGVIQNGEIVAEYAKQCLPNYQVFDEKRYFTAGDKPCVIELHGMRVGISICEDLWDGAPVSQAKAAGAQVIFNLNASPFHRGKLVERQALLKARAEDAGIPIVYVNQVGGQDELVFDGASMVVDAEGRIQCSAEAFVEELVPVRLHPGDMVHVSEQLVQDVLPDLAAVYQALVLGVRDYVNKNGFKGVVLGLSGGIDSALTLAVAVDALGADRVEAVMMPFRYTSDMSKSDAQEEAEYLGVEYQSLSIEPMWDAFMATLEKEFEGTERDTTEENLQARCRGVLLMAISNKKGYLVLTTGNKSEMAVGYATLYGDMAGGFDVLKDVPKTLVFALSKYRNSISYVIPNRVIERPPSAELAPDQKDEDSLPPYDVLDAILAYYVEQDMSADTIVAKGFDAEQVYRVIRLVDLNEYKRRQAAIGPRITSKGFGRDRRYPITSGWKAGL